MAVSPVKMKNMRFKAGTFAFLFSAATMFLCEHKAFCLDFKIDLPPEKGLATVDNDDYLDNDLSVTQEQSDALSPELSNAQIDLPSPVPPSGGPQKWTPEKDVSKELRGVVPPDGVATGKALRSEQSRSLNLPNGTSFPNPTCLSANVAFWKKVYAEVEIQDAVIHDRDDLDKIYGVVRLGGSQSQRQSSIKLLRDHYRLALRSLADKLGSPALWNSTERALAKQFRPSELTRGRLLQASENIRTQQGLKSRFNAGVQRSLQYLPTIKEILRQQNLPLDIAFLPHVESSYVNHARSRVGAVGLWQLMPETMRLLMGRNAVQRRTDPMVATQAAAKLLKQNFSATGSWPLALTAYNHGLAGVLRAVRNTSSTDLCKIIERYNSPSFRFASSNFYAQFLAAREIALQRYGELSKNRDVGRIVAPLIASREKGAL